jgi:hypothetical protein
MHRDLFLLSRGVYTSNLPSRLTPDREGVPLRFALRQNLPNPFASATTIRFDLPAMARVQLEIFDVLGRRVTTLVDGVYRAGYHSAVWDRRDRLGYQASPGVYFYRLSSGPLVERRKMVLLP